MNENFHFDRLFRKHFHCEQEGRTKIDSSHGRQKSFSIDQSESEEADFLSLSSFDEEIDLR
jgi:hypothetical protein